MPARGAAPCATDAQSDTSARRFRPPMPFAKTAGWPGPPARLFWMIFRRAMGRRRRGSKLLRQGQEHHLDGGRPLTGRGITGERCVDRASNCPRAACSFLKWTIMLEGVVSARLIPCRAGLTAKDHTAPLVARLEGRDVYTSTTPKPNFYCENAVGTSTVIQGDIGGLAPASKSRSRGT